MKYGFKVAAIVLAGLTGLVLIGLFIINHFFFSMSKLPEGELLTKAISPSGQYTVNAYVSRSGATVADAVRGELVNHHKRDKTKNIYWQYRESEAEVSWSSDHTVSINGIELDVRKDVFDFRKE